MSGTDVLAGLVGFLCIVTAGCTGGGAAECEDPPEGSSDMDGGNDSESDTDTKTDTGSDTEEDADCECSDPTCGIGVECHLEDSPCPCDKFCSQEVWWWRMMDAYFEHFYCYGTCEKGGTCPGEHETCTPIDEEETIHACLPTATANGKEWRAKIIPFDAIPVIGDYATNDVTVVWNGREMTFAWTYGLDYPDDNFVLILLLRMELLEPAWILQFQIPRALWAEGTYQMFEDVDGARRQNFNAAMYRQSLETDGTVWQEGFPVGGSITITNAGEVCQGLDCEWSTGSEFNLEFREARGVMLPMPEEE